MQEADFCTNQGDDFVPGFHGDALLEIGVDKRGEFWLSFFVISSKQFQVRWNSKLFFSNSRMRRHVQIWIDRHGVGISTKAVQHRRIFDLIFSNPQSCSRLSNLIYRHSVV